jgi:hypothetical protein
LKALKAVFLLLYRTLRFPLPSCRFTMAPPSENAILAAQQPALSSSSSIDEDNKDFPSTKERSSSVASSLYDYKNAAPLAPVDEAPPSVGFAFLQSLGLKKKTKPFDLDAVNLSFSHSLLVSRSLLVSGDCPPRLPSLIHPSLVGRNEGVGLGH